MRKADLVEESNIPYNSPMVCVLKPNEQLWVCIYFRMINRDIVTNAYPMHQFDEKLKAMAGSTVFTTLDLTKVYHQLVLHTKSKNITAFLSLEGLFG